MIDRPGIDVARRMAAQFGAEDDVRITPVVSGHINESFRVCAPGVDLLLQWVNPVAFPQARGVQRNAETVLDHLQKKAPGRYPALVKTRDGRGHAEDATSLWRALRWLPDRVTLTGPDGTSRAEVAGAALGEFVMALRDLPAGALDAVHEGFHDLAVRLQRFDAAFASASAARRRDATEVIDRVQRQREHHVELRPGGAEWTLHGDPKFTNLLFDDAGAAVLVDYDTIMPGPLGWDFGDFLRSAASAGAEDAPERAGVDVEMAVAGARGFARAVQDEAGRPDAQSLARAPAYIAFNLGVRFVTDHLEGDRYFRTLRAGHNLDRAATQLAIASAFDDERQRLADVLAETWSAAHA